MTCGLTWFFLHIPLILNSINLFDIDFDDFELKKAKKAMVFLKIYLVTPGHNKKLFVKLFYIDCRFKILKISKSFLENLPGHTWSHLVTT